jgi:hypothetical protein
MKISAKRWIGLSLFLSLCPLAEAGVFNMPRFVDPGKNAVGVEPEVVLSDEGGVGANLHYTQGLTDINNAFAVLGTGTNVRTFRIGGGFTFDFVPDLDTQPGFGVGAQAIYYRYKYSVGRLETSLVPYVHKAFGNGKGQSVEPYLALPFGPAFRSGTYDWTSQLVIGAMFHEDHAQIRYLAEFGVNLAKSETYISGGILYQP